MVLVGQRVQVGDVLGMRSKWGQGLQCCKKDN